MAVDPGRRKEKTVLVSPSSPNRFRACPCCGRIETDMDAVEAIGVLEDEEGRRCFILFQCRCNNTRATPWGESSDELKRRALKAQE